MRANPGWPLLSIHTSRLIRADSKMREILGVTDEPRTRRRWFHDDYFDLFVWQTAGGEITLFQLCYGIGSSERALVWHKYGGYFHDGTRAKRSREIVGAGSGPGKQPAADPVLLRFEEAALSLPEDIRRAVAERLREYVENKPEIPMRRKRFRREEWQKRPGAKPAIKRPRQPPMDTDKHR
jgi:hypothetical protein